MPHSICPETASNIRRWARTKPLISKITALGSRAAGTNLPNSDFDLAFEIDPDPNDSCAMATWWGVRDQWLEELQSLVPVELQLELLDDEFNTQTVR